MVFLRLIIAKIASEDRIEALFLKKTDKFFTFIIVLFIR